MLAVEEGRGGGFGAEFDFLPLLLLMPLKVSRELLLLIPCKGPTIFICTLFHSCCLANSFLPVMVGGSSNLPICSGLTVDPGHSRSPPLNLNLSGQLRLFSTAPQWVFIASQIGELEANLRINLHLFVYVTFLV